MIKKTYSKIFIINFNSLIERNAVENNGQIFNINSQQIAELGRVDEPVFFRLELKVPAGQRGVGQVAEVIARFWRTLVLVDQIRKT